MHKGFSFFFWFIFPHNGKLKYPQIQVCWLDAVLFAYRKAEERKSGRIFGIFNNMLPRKKKATQLIFFDKTLIRKPDSSDYKKLHKLINLGKL